VTDDTTFPPDAVRDDLLVAGVAAVATVALSVALRFGVGVSAPVVSRLSPIAVYFLYVFLGKGKSDRRWQDPRLWAVLSALVAVVTFGYYAV
jgi:hypothetical protein